MAKEKKATSEEDKISSIKDVFRQCQDARSDNETMFLEDYRFGRMGEQWPADVEAQRKREKRPCLTINKLQAIIKQIVNDCRQNKPSIKVRPADDQSDPETAEVMSGLILNIEQISGADAAYDTAVECAASGGFGYFRIKLDYAHDDSFDLDILIDRIPNALTVYGDPWSTAVDSSDWNHAFITETMSEEEFKKRYPDNEATSWDGSKDRKSTTAEDVMVAEYWCRKEVEKQIVKLSDGRVMAKAEYEADPTLAAYGITVTAEKTIKSWKVYQTILSGSEILVDEQEWPGKYIPIVPVYGEELNDEGKRLFRSAIHYSKDAQRMFNYWRTTTTELVALAPRVPYIGPEEAFNGEDSEKWESANTGNYAYIAYKGGIPPQRQPLGSEVPAGSLQEALSAADDIKATSGLYDASLGARSNETSGVAIERRKMEGDTATFHFTDNLARAIRHAGRILIDLIPRVYKQDRVVRVLGEDGTAQNVRLGPSQPAPEGVNQPGQPKTYAGVYDLGVGKYDLVVDSGPSYSTRRVETAEQIMRLIQSAPDVASRIADILAKNLDWKGADLIAERLKPADQATIPPEVQAQIEQGKQMLADLSKENEQLKSQNLKNAADVQKFQFEREKLDLDKQRLPIEQMQAQADLLVKQKELVLAQAQGGAMVEESTAAAGEKNATASAMNEFAQAAKMLSEAAAVMQAGIADLQVKVSQPRVKKGVAKKNPMTGNWELDTVEAVA